MNKTTSRNILIYYDYFDAINCTVNLSYLFY